MRELRQRLFLRLTTWFTLTACFAVLIFGALLAGNLSKVLTLWGDDIQITAYLDKNLTADEIAKIETNLKADKRIGKTDFVPRERALDEFRVQMASYAPDLVTDDDLLGLIPASFQISLTDSIPAKQQVDEIRNLSASLQKTAGIEEVRYGQEWVQKYAAVLSAAKASMGTLGAILLIAALLVIGNSVRASIDARRNEIEVLELIGATSWSIRKPFMMEGAVLGFASATSALIASFVIFAVIRGLVRSELSFLQLADHLSFLSPVMVLLCLATGAGLGLLASYICVRRVNTGWAAAGGGTR